MIVYNVTAKIDRDVHDEWLDWMKSIHIPDVMNTGLFKDNRICRLLGVNESDGITYAIQYMCEDMATFQKYQTANAEFLDIISNKLEKKRI